MTWSEIPLRSLYRRVEESGRPDLPLLSVYRDYGVVPRRGREDNYNKPSADLSGYKIVQRRDLVINKMKAWQGSLGVSNYDGIVSPAYFVGRPIGDVDDHFVHHLLRSSPLIAEYGARSKGIRPSQWDLPWNEFASIKVHLPTSDTQRELASYLDTKTACIDALISKKRRISDLFESRLIAHAEDAIKGRSSDKATGIPSLSGIPASWQVLRNKVFIRETNHRSIDGNDEMLSVSHITGVTPRSEKMVYMFEAESTVGYKLVRPGDLVINTMWAWMGAAGVSDMHGIVSPAYGVYEFDNSIMLPKFYDVLVRTPAYIAEMTRFSRGVTSSRLRLYPDEFLRLSSPVPPIKTQKAIIERHASHESTTSQARKCIARQIQLLLERRQALITAVMTGEMSVPKTAA